MNKNIAVYDNTVNARTYLSYIAEQAGGFACIGRDGKLYIKTIGEDTVQLDIEKFQDFVWGEKFKVSRVAYEDGIQDFKFGDTTNNTVWINQENMYIVDEEQVENIYNELEDFECYSFEGSSIIDPSIDVGDIAVIDGKKVIFQGDMEYLGKFKASISSKIQSKSKEDTMTRIPSQKVINRRVESRIDQQDGIIEQIVSEVDENNERISIITQNINEINSKVENIEDLTRIKTGNKTVTINDAYPNENILELHIYGNNNVFSYLYPEDDLYPNDTLYPHGDSRIRFYNNEEDITIDLGIEEVLRVNSEVNDEVSIDHEGNVRLIRRVNADGTTKAQEEITLLGTLHFKLIEGNNTFTILNYNAQIEVKYAIKSDYTDIFTTKKEMNSEISQTAQEIDLSVNQKLTNYSTTSEMNSAIQITANSINQTVENNNTKVNIIAKINDNTSSAKIDADVVELTANDILNLIAGNTINLAAKNIIISSNTTKITGSGQKFYHNGTEIGNIGTNNYTGHSDQRGLVFDLNPNGSYMTWAKQESSGSSYMMKLYYCVAGSCGNTDEGIYLGSNLYAAGNRIYGKRFYLDNGIYIVDSFYSGSGGKIFKISDNGTDVALFSNTQNNLYADLYINGAIVQTQTSDGRLKHDIQSSEINAIDKIMQIKHRMFKWNKDNKEEQVGYIAQELEEIDANYVIKNPQYDEKGEIIDYLYQVNILPILATCTKAFQELKEENDKYKNLIEQIAEKLDIKEETKKSRVSQTKGASEKIDFGNEIKYSKNIIEEKENRKIMKIDKDGIVRKEEKR